MVRTRSRRAKRRKISKQVVEESVEDKRKKALRSLRTDLVDKVIELKKRLVVRGNGFCKSVSSDDDTSSEELHEVIFNKENILRWSYPWKSLMRKLNKNSLDELMSQYFPILGETENGEEEPIKRNNIVNWIKEKAFGETSNTAKRAIEAKFIESQYKKSDDERFFKFLKTEVPIEIVKKVVSFLPKNRTLLNTLGLVNQQYYLLCLTSIQKIVIRKSIKEIPILVLENAKDVSLVPKLYVEDLRELFPQLKNVEVFRISDKCASSFHSAVIKSPSFSFPKLKHLDFVTYPQSVYAFNNLNAKHIKEEYFPKLKQLSVGRIEGKEIPIIGQIETLTTKTITNNGYTFIDFSKAKNLKELTILSILPFRNYQLGLKNLLNLKKIKKLTSPTCHSAFSDFFCSLTSLEELNVDYKDRRPFSCEEFKNLPNLKNLKRFSFRFLGVITDDNLKQIFKYLYQCKSLEHIEFVNRTTFPNAFDTENTFEKERQKFFRILRKVIPNNNEKVVLYSQISSHFQ